jgi:hypothetical protein
LGDRAETMALKVLILGGTNEARRLADFAWRATIASRRCCRSRAAPRTCCCRPLLTGWVASAGRSASLRVLERERFARADRRHASVRRPDSRRTRSRLRAGLELPRDCGSSGRAWQAQPGDRFVRVFQMIEAVSRDRRETAAGPAHDRTPGGRELSK